MKKCLMVLLCLLFKVGYAQQVNSAIPGPGYKPLLVNISLPLSGAVYQRNAQNNGRIRVIGTYNGLSTTNNSSSVAAWLTKLNLQSGSPVGNASININMAQDGPCFQGEIEADAG
ncbi:hypothetical protein [Fibrella forsythiae]|uniref:CHRD domain-containing protein n=1 Tax=Fibrella forsythiae TaxID=2817061 RepID=A0ABS3JC99_9BACT|nr:hypothetical protein [Fibrella forsythiae]MBO0947619.1 hypothetical protein [Fibrella forsythiae]